MLYTSWIKTLMMEFPALWYLCEREIFAQVSGVLPLVLGCEITYFLGVCCQLKIFG